jgi:hypothetical protein
MVKSLTIYIVWEGVAEEVLCKKSTCGDVCLCIHFKDTIVIHTEIIKHNLYWVLKQSLLIFILSEIFSNRLIFNIKGSKIFM